MNNYTYKPFKYWFLTLLITWITLFIAVYFSYNEELISYKNIFILIALFTPFIIAMFMVFCSKNENLKKDFKERLINLELIKTKYWLFILLIMPITLLIATSISLLFGQPTNQFFLSSEITLFGGETLIILIILLLAPTFEELGWRGYGVDSLKKGNTIFRTTLFFAILWITWHIPLYFINGYYQNELLHISYVYAANFIFQNFVAAFLMNWIYYKNNRSIFAIIIFHIMLNLFSVLFQTEQFTKCIITIILMIISGIIIYKDREFLFKKYEK